MLVRLLKDARIKHSAGDIVNVSPAEYGFLTSLGVAVPAEEKKTEAKKKKAVKND